MIKHSKFLFIIVLLILLALLIFKLLLNMPLYTAVTAAKMYVHDSKIEQIINDPSEYLIKSDNAYATLKTHLENSGWEYIENSSDNDSILFSNGESTLQAVKQDKNKGYAIIRIHEPEPIKTETISLMATGDILMHNTVVWSGDNNGQYSYDHLFAPVKSLIQKADIASVNLESPIAGPEGGYPGYPLFNSPDELATSLKNSAFDVVITANNHCMDRGLKGGLRTLDILRKSGLDTTGTFKSPTEANTFLIKDIRGVKIAYLAYTYGTNGIPLPQNEPYFCNILDQEKIIADIHKLRSQVDVLVLVLHWGVEYSPLPTQKQEQLAQSFFKEGADLILGSHPHVIQPMEIMNIDGKDKLVVYSMGNSVGHQRGIERNSGVIMKVEFSKNFVTGETIMTKADYTPTFSHPYYLNGKQMFRMIDIGETLNAIHNGTEPYLNEDSVPLLEKVLENTSKQMGKPFYAQEN